jgi:hypothetical protein
MKVPLFTIVLQAVTWTLLLAAALVVLRRTPLSGRAVPILVAAAIVAVLLVLRRIGRTGAGGG